MCLVAQRKGMVINMNEAELIEKQIPNGLGTFYLRPNRFDEEIYESIVYEQEYGFIQYLKEVRVIIDAGANIGVSAVCFAIEHPQAVIYAIEPEKENFAMLRRNTETYPNIIPLNCALMGRVGHGSILDCGSSLGYQIDGSRDGEVDCISISSLCAQQGISHIDILKIDIEGAEKEVFEAAADWIDQVDILVTELHERLIKGCSFAVFQVVDPRFQMAWVGGENYYFAKTDAAVPAIPSTSREMPLAFRRIEILSKMRDNLDRLHTKICAEKDARLDELGRLLAENSEEFGRVCAEKDARLDELGRLLSENSERFSQICAEKDALIEELQKKLAESSRKADMACAERSGPAGWHVQLHQKRGLIGAISEKDGPEA